MSHMWTKEIGKKLNRTLRKEGIQQKERLAQIELEEKQKQEKLRQEEKLRRRRWPKPEDAEEPKKEEEVVEKEVEKVVEDKVEEVEVAAKAKPKITTNPVHWFAPLPEKGKALTRPDYFMASASLFSLTSSVLELQVGVCIVNSDNKIVKMKCNCRSWTPEAVLAEQPAAAEDYFPQSFEEELKKADELRKAIEQSYKTNPFTKKQTPMNTPILPVPELMKHIYGHHAVLRAFHDSAVPIENGTVYMTHAPCMTCLYYLQHLDIARVAYLHTIDCFGNEVIEQKVGEGFKNIWVELFRPTVAEIRFETDVDPMTWYSKYRGKNLSKHAIVPIVRKKDSEGGSTAPESIHFLSHLKDFHKKN